MDSRKAARQKLATLLDTEVPTLKAVYDRETLGFAGLSPVATVHSDGTAAVYPALSGDHRAQALIITLYWVWTETTENSLDDLSAEVLTVIEDNKGENDTWDGMDLDEAFSQLDYAEIDEITYRVERIRVICW